MNIDIVTILISDDEDETTKGIDVEKNIVENKEISDSGNPEYFRKRKDFPDSESTCEAVRNLDSTQFIMASANSSKKQKKCIESLDEKRELKDTEVATNEESVQKTKVGDANNMDIEVVTIFSSDDEDDDDNNNMNIEVVAILSSDDDDDDKNSMNPVSGIYSLPEEILIKIFKYLSKKELVRISRVCKWWHESTRCPLLWKKVDLQFQWNETLSQNILTKNISKYLPHSLTHLKLDFGILYWMEPLKFEVFCMRLAEKSPSLNVLILHRTKFSVNLQSVINLCRQYMQNLDVLSIHYSKFTDHSVKGDNSNVCKIKVLDFCCNDGIENSSKLTFSNMISLKKINFIGTGANDSWFEGDTSFLDSLEVLNLQWAHRISSKTFQTLKKCALNLRELYLCATRIGSSDFNFSNPVFPQLEHLCLTDCKVSHEEIVSLIRACNTLKNVYVNGSKDAYAHDPFVAANNSKLHIVKIIGACRHNMQNYLHEQ